jgi:hypothetical protein
MGTGAKGTNYSFIMQPYSPKSYLRDSKQCEDVKI